MSRTRVFGIVLALVSSVFFALANTMAGVACVGGSNSFTLTTTRFVLPAVFLFVILLASGKAIALDRRSAIVATILGVISAVYTLALLMAIERLPVAIAILIFYLFPVFTPFFLAGLGWERLRTKTVVSAVVVFFGLGMALAVQFGALDPVGMLAGLVSAVGFATVCTISNRLMGGQDSRRATLYLSAGATGAMLIAALFAGDILLPVTPMGWVGFTLSNVLYACGIIGFYIALSIVGAAAATFFINLEPIVVVGAGYVFLGQMITGWQMVGVAIVVGALIYASQGDGREPALTASES